jgi:hypothetical protein
MLRFRYMLVRYKPYISMNNNTVSRKLVLMIATMLSTVMLAASSMSSLAPATAFAEQDGSVDDLLRQISSSSDSQNESRENEGGANSVTVDPIVQTAVQPAVNVNVDTHVITDKANCEEANDNVDQANDQSADQQGRSDGTVGEGSLYVSPKVQTAQQVALNVNVDTDVIIADGCTPRDNLNQANDQSTSQDAGSNVDAGKGSNIILPTIQNSGTLAQNLNVNNDVIQPVPLLQ